MMIERAAGLELLQQVMEVKEAMFEKGERGDGGGGLVCVLWDGLVCSFSVFVVRFFIWGWGFV